MKTIYVIVLALALLGTAQGQDSLGMRCLSNLVYWQGIGTMQLVGSRGYFNSGSSGLHVMDLSDSAHPVEITRLPDGGGFYVKDSLMYRAMYSGGQVLDISDVTQPRIVGEWINEDISGISFVHGGWAIGETSEGYPFVLDVSDPINVHEIGEFVELLGWGKALGVVGGYLCINGYPGGVWIYDMNNPSQPQLVAVADTTFPGTGKLVGNYAYLATNAGIRIVDLTNPAQPVVVGVCDTIWYTDVAVIGTHVVGTRWQSNLTVWNVSDPVHPVQEGSLSLSTQWPGRIISSPNRICVEGGDSMCVSVLDITSPASPTFVSSFGPDGACLRMAIGGNTGYVCDIGIRTLDLTDASHVRELGNTNHHSNGGADVALRGNYAYVVEGNWGLRIFDISNPAQPESVSCVCLPNWNPFRTTVFGDYAYVIDDHYQGGQGSSYLDALSLANPAAPQIQDSVVVTGLYEESTFHIPLQVSSGYLYFAGSLGPFQVFSLADPAHPQLAGSCDIPGYGSAWAVDMAIAGNHAYVADHYGGVVIMNISDPAHPTFSGRRFAGENVVETVAANGNTLFTSDRVHVNVYDLTDPTNPTPIGYYGTNEWLNQMEVAGPYLYTTSDAEFRVYQVDALDAALPRKAVPYEFALHPAYPNPFNPTTMIAFSLPKTEHATLIVYDVTGREVTVLTDRVLAAGDHRVTFDGSALASGVYFARLEAGKNVKTEKLMLLK